jgi:hypothetical protein
MPNSHGRSSPQPTGKTGLEVFDVYTTDFRTGKATRFNIGKGIAVFHGPWVKLAVFKVLRPAADGDLLRFLDVNPASPRASGTMQSYCNFLRIATSVTIRTKVIENLDTRSLGHNLPVGPRQRSTVPRGRDSSRCSTGEQIGDKPLPAGRSADTRTAADPENR